MERQNNGSRSKGSLERRHHSGESSDHRRASAPARGEPRRGPGRWRPGESEDARAPRRRGGEGLARRDLCASPTSIDAANGRRPDDRPSTARRAGNALERRGARQGGGEGGGARGARGRRARRSTTVPAIAPGRPAARARQMDAAARGAATGRLGEPDARSGRLEALGTSHTAVMRLRGATRRAGGHPFLGGGARAGKRARAREGEIPGDGDGELAAQGGAEKRSERETFDSRPAAARTSATLIGRFGSAGAFFFGSQKHATMREMPSKEPVGRGR